ncbi:MAG: PTS sugar transporter subunit IIA [Treponema sp.]|jgi:PTS system fructose-specific IIC component/PTS system nitrogen regulatory IIA component|nr:PTS sugar transporter subunit IIA [Treponema sp.]
MDLCEVFKPEFIKVNLEAEDKEEAFEELADHFCRASGLNIREEVLQAVRDREAKMSTGIRQGIAIPHGRTNAVDRISGILGVSRRGVDYDALDGKPVYLLFLILAPERDTEKHLQLLKRLAELLDNPQFYTDMAAQTTVGGAFAVLKKYEDILTAL